MFETEHGNPLIANRNGVIIDAYSIGFNCPYCNKECMTSIKNILEEPFYCSCGEEVAVRISCNVGRDNNETKGIWSRR